MELEELNSLNEHELEAMSIEEMPPQTTACKTVSMFQQFAGELDQKYDKIERLVKLSRDITIESKRVIFQLHRISTEPGTMEKSEEKLHFIRERFIHKIALELEGEDKFYFIRSFTAGLQEFIEAFAFYKFLKDGMLLNYEQFQKLLTFVVYCDTGYQCSSDKQSRTCSGNRERLTDRRGGGARRGWRGGRRNHREEKYRTSNNSTSASNDLQHCVDSDKMEIESNNSNNDAKMEQEPVLVPVVRESSIDGPPVVPKLEDDCSSSSAEIPSTEAPQPSGETKILSIYFPQIDFLLGLSDLTGEMMRSCVSAAAQGDETFCFKACEFVQHFQSGCVALSFVRRDMMQKMHTTKTNCVKMERMCYGLRIREGVKSKPYSYIYDVVYDENGDDDEDSGLD